MQTTLNKTKLIPAKPFLKWAGGKGQLLEEFNQRLPEEILKSKKIKNYVEPFIGGGAMFFFLKNNYHIKNSTIMDINKELILGYNVIKKKSARLIDELCALEADYLSKNEADRKDYYYLIRTEYNTQMIDFDYSKFNSDWIKRASYLIFLNKTCFNGLFRQNKKGEFNVPIGRYKNPKICDNENISHVSKALKNTQIICGDFSTSEEYITPQTMVYLDPPYRPINKTSHFTSYAKEGFSDDDQIRLAQFFRDMEKKGAYLMLSNSDPKNNDPDDQFFDELYSNYYIERVPAKRFINCDASKRGSINEIIVRNYQGDINGKI